VVQTTVGSSLVAGATASSTKEQAMQVTVTRPFYYRGTPTMIGAVLELDRAFARELIANGKASEAVAPDVMAAAAPIDTPDDAEEVSRPRRGRPPKPKE
jgi:hemoglobin-like flavoprotein